MITTKRDRTMLMLNDPSVTDGGFSANKRDRTMLMLNCNHACHYFFYLHIGDRTMLMLNLDFILHTLRPVAIRDRTMLMLNHSKINILFLHYILYILIFQSLIEILPADFSFLPIFFNA